MDPETKYDKLFHKDHYTVDEVAYLLDRAPSIIASEVLNHRLPATIVGHDILWIKRHDLLEWLQSTT